MAARTRRRLLAGAAATLALAGLAGGAAMAVGGDRTEAVRDAVRGGQARNVIFLLGDGMGEAEITAARERLAEGTYGTCERCGGRIGEGRLEARPTARTCIACAGRPGGALPGP